MTPTPASATERALHWAVAVVVLVLAGTGAVMYVPALSQAVGQRFWVRTLHLAGAAGLVAVPAALALLRWPAVRSLESELSVWGPAAAAWFVRPWRVLRNRGAALPASADRFNGGQKLFAAVAAAALSVLLATGIPMYWWERFGADLVARSRDLHVVTAFALVALLAGHVYLGLLSPYGLVQRRRAEGGRPPGPPG